MSTVLTEDRGAVRIITLNRPERLNAITEQLIADLNAALIDAQADDGVRAIVLTGAGRAFCAGDDLHVGPRLVSGDGRITPVAFLNAYPNDQLAVSLPALRSAMKQVEAMSGVVKGLLDTEIKPNVN